jgi:hypothetical protein
MKALPRIIDFKQIGKPVEGYISVAESDKNIPFKLKRVFWTYYTPESIVRGKHAHHKTEMVLIAAAGKIIVNTEMQNGEKATFILDKPTMGLYLPPKTWHTMTYTHNAIQLVLASTLYLEKDYIRSYGKFKKKK